MKKSRTWLAFLALALAVATVLPGTWAYFTANARAGGGRTVQLQDDTDINEDFTFATWQKSITITATKGTQPVYLRARAFSPNPTTYPLECAGEGWVQSGDWWYYTKALAWPVEGEKDAAMPDWMTHAATELTVKICDGKGPQVSQEGEIPEDFDVTVVYETTPVVYEEDGSHKSAAEADWSPELVENKEWRRG